MKKFIVAVFVLILLITTFPEPVKAFHTPLSAPQWNASVNAESHIKLVSYKAHVNIDNNMTYVNARSVIRNTSDENIEVIIGTPQQFTDKKITINNLEVFVNGIKQTLSTRNNETNPDSTGIKDLPDRWLSFNVSLKPGESKVIDSSLSFENSSDSGTAEIYLPLDYLEPWEGTVTNIEVDVESNKFPTGILEANPIIMPTYIGHNGDLSWSFSEANTPSPIRFKYNSIDEIIAEHLKAGAEDNDKVNKIINHYNNMEYDTTVSLVDDYIKEYPNTPINFELYLLQAISFNTIGKFDSALQIYEHMLENPSSLTKTEILKNSVLYELYWSNIAKDNDKAVSDFLMRIKSYVAGNDVFALFLQNQIEMLPEPEPQEPLETSEPAKEPTETDTPSDKELVKFIKIYGFKIPVEFIFLGVFVLIILIILYATGRRRRKRQKTTLFRY